MESSLILLAIFVASLPFVLPIVGLVRQSRLRSRLAALEDALDDQRRTIDTLERRLTHLSRDLVASAPPLAKPAVPSVPAREPAAAPPPVPPPPIVRPEVTPPPVTPPTAAAPPPRRAPEKPPVLPPVPPRIEPRDVGPMPPPAISSTSWLKAFDWEQLVGV